LKGAAREVGSAQLTYTSGLGRRIKLAWGGTYLLNILRDEKERWRLGVGMGELMGREKLWELKSFGREARGEDPERR
jgi:hypothetical protein